MKKQGKTKVMGIGKTGATSIYKLYKETYGDNKINFDSDEFIEQCTEIISFFKKIDDDEIKSDISKKLKRNRKLTKLTKTIYQII